MIHYNCACLVHWQDEQVMLVKVRDNEKYYFPGGKIEADETPMSALIREVEEELGIILEEQYIIDHGNVHGPAYPDAAETVALQCFSYSRPLGDIQPESEITEIRYVDVTSTELMAPAVVEVINYLKGDLYEE